MASIDLGLVTAYGNAKEGGYTGTESEFNDLLANLPTYTAQANTYKNQAAASATSANNAADRAEAIVGGQFVSYGTNQGLSDAQKAQAQKNIGPISSNDNLLDNGWFTLNQRATSDPSTRYDFPADRWYILNAGATYHLNTNAGLTITLNEGVSYTRLAQRQATQQFRRAVGQSVTFGVYTGWGYFSATGTIPSAPASGTVDIIPTTYIKTDNVNRAYILLQWDGDNDCIIAMICFYQSGSIRAAKVEIGTMSTLPNDTAPNYASELIRCQRHYFRVHPTTAGSPLGTGYALSATTIRILVPTPVWMRDPDQLALSSIENFRLIGNGQSLTPTAAEIHSNARNGVVLSFTVSGATASQSYSLTQTSTGIYLGFGKTYW